MKKIRAACAAALILAIYTGCAKTAESDGGDTEVWATYATRKVLQNSAEENDRFSSLEILAAKGEYESGQVILSAGNKAVKYAVETGDLTSGDNVFLKENISLYHEKYAEVAKNYENTSAPAGFYPDALVPYSAIVKRGENVVNANENQGIYVTFNVPADQPAGIYKGDLIITAGGVETRLPVTLEVCGFSVSETVHSKSIFLTEWSYASGELNASQEMLDAYTEKLIEYRLAPHYVVTDGTATDEDIEYYVNKAAEYLKNPRCSNLCIPYSTTIVGGDTCIDGENLKIYLRKFAEKSFADGFDYCAKLTLYFNIIDEPHLTGTTERVKTVSEVYRAALNETAIEIEEGKIAADNASEELVKSVAASVRSIKNVVTTYYDESLSAYVNTWCPTVDQYDYLSEKYDTQEEKWWYTCNNPKAPYPTFHTEDTLVSARALGWMMTEYDVTGNLYWATNIYAAYEDGAYKPLDDYFTQASHFPNVNGDGYLFYPGGQYGLSSPIASVRLEALRDGLEEYEIGYAMKENYARLSAATGEEKTFDGIYKNIVSSVYSGTRVYASDRSFAVARENLYRLADLAFSPANVCITAFSDDDYGRLTYEIYAKQGYDLKNGGKTLTPAAEKNGYNVYTLSFDLSAGENLIGLSVECDGKTYSFEKYLGGKIEAYSFETRSGEFSALDGATVEAVAALAPDGSDNTWLNIIAGDAPKNKWQNFKWKSDAVSAFSADISKAVLHIYYTKETPLDVTVSAKYTGNALLGDVKKFTLKQGMNTVTLAGLDGYNWERLGRIEYLAFYLGGKKGNAATDGIWFVGMTVYAA